MVGQRYIDLLRDHPWFEVSYLAASQRSAGKKYSDAVKGRWYMKKAIPENVKELKVNTIDEIQKCKQECDFVFSALGSDIAREYEEKYATATKKQRDEIAQMQLWKRKLEEERRNMKEQLEILETRYATGELTEANYTKELKKIKEGYDTKKLAISELSDVLASIK